MNEGRAVPGGSNNLTVGNSTIGSVVQILGQSGSPCPSHAGGTMRLSDEPGSTKVLFLAANPADSTFLRLDRECREIDAAVRDSPHRDAFELRRHGAVRAGDLQSLLLRHRPHILHFSGHGQRFEGLALEDAAGATATVSTEALANLFELFSDTIRCVVLNACFSRDQGLAIAESIDCVIATVHPVGDDAAVAFTRAFYRSLAYADSVRRAFDLGCAEVAAAADGEPAPVLLIRTGTDPADIVFAPR